MRRTPQNIENHQTVVYIQNQRKWSPGIAAVLSFLIPGLGQLYRGKILRGLLWFLAAVIGYAAFIVPGIVIHLLCIFAAASGDPTK